MHGLVHPEIGIFISNSKQPTIKVSRKYFILFEQVHSPAGIAVAQTLVLSRESTHIRHGKRMSNIAG